MEQSLAEDITLTWGDLCAALAEGELASRRSADSYKVRVLDVRRLQRRDGWQMLPLDRWLDVTQSGAGIFA